MRRGELDVVLCAFQVALLRCNPLIFRRSQQQRRGKRKAGRRCHHSEAGRLFCHAPRTVHSLSTSNSAPRKGAFCLNSRNVNAELPSRWHRAALVLAGGTSTPYQLCTAQAPATSQYPSQRAALKDMRICASQTFRALQPRSCSPLPTVATNMSPKSS